MASPQQQQGRWSNRTIAVASLAASSLALACLGLIRSSPSHRTAASVERVTLKNEPNAEGTLVQRQWVWECNSTHRYAHMSMIEALAGGRLAAAWQAAPGHEGESMAGLGRVQGLWYSVSPDNGYTWPPPSVAVGGVAPSWGPVLHLDASEGLLWLFYSHSRVEEAPGGDVVYRTTGDLTSSSPSWSPPTVIWRSEDLDGFPKVTANRLEVVPGSAGDWLLPVWQEHSKKAIGISSMLVGRRDPGAPDGRSWVVQERMSSSRAGWLIEGTVARLPASGSILQLFRTKDRRVWRSLSNDGGRTWGEPARAAGLQNPNSKIAMTAVTDANGRHLGVVLAYNPSEDVRSPLVMSFSEDGGPPWKEFAVLEDEEQAPGRWYAYPTVIQQGTWLHCSYTVYDHLEEGDVIGVAETSSGVRGCPGGAAVCSGEGGDEALLEADPHISVRVRKLKNKFLGLRIASVPVSQLPAEVYFQM